MKEFIAELIGTFFLVMGAALYGAVGASLSLMVMIYASGHISGAHFNPAVTLAMMIRGKSNLKNAISYWIAQFAGAILAALIVSYIFKINGSGNCVIPEDGNLKAIVAEVLGTFALAYVVLNVATTTGTKGNSFYGIAIGGTVLAMALTIGQFSGGAYNPAVALGLSIQKSFCFSQLWIYIVACFAGGAIAAVLFNYINIDDKPTPPIADAGEQ